VKELDSVSRQLAVVEHELENEVVKSSDYENRIKTLQNELSLKAQVHKQVFLLAILVSYLSKVCIIQIFFTGYALA